MLYLMKVYRQQEIQDGGLKKGKCLVVNCHFSGNILNTPNIELHITQKRNSNDYVHVCEVSESIAIDIYATQLQKKP